MTACLSTQILWDAQNARMFGDLCRRTLQLCKEGQPCPLVSAERRILLVSSQRDSTPSPQRTAPVAQCAPQARTAGRPDRRAVAGV